MNDDLYGGFGAAPDRPQAVTPSSNVIPFRPAAADLAGDRALIPEVVPPRSTTRATTDIDISGGARAAGVVKETIPVETDSDSLTAATVRKMCEYIKAGAADDYVKWWAECAITRYALGNRAPEAACWGIYWLVKHAVEFARDEPRLFQVGEPDALDMLIAPAVLVRMAAPKEDCDGFTMLICAIAAVLGIRTLIVTVAADPSDESRWSHVFPVALVNGRTLPLDASHGHAPGWMVPREHIFRWQAWDLDGNRVELPIPSKRAAGLHGYTRRGARMRSRGMGQCSDDEGNSIPCDTSTSTPPPVMTGSLPCSDQYGNIISCGGSAPGSVLQASPLPCYLPSGATTVCGGYAPGTTIPSTVAPGSASIPIPGTSAAPSDIASIIQSAISGAVRVAQTAFLPPGSYYTTNPITGQQTLVTASSGVAVNPLSALSGSSILPIAAIALVAFLLLSMSEKK